MLVSVIVLSCAPKKSQADLEAQAARLEAAEAEQAAKIAGLEKQLADLAAAQTAPKTGLSETQKKEQEAKAAEIAKQLASANGTGENGNPKAGNNRSS
jgi:hypothetical protein